MCVILDKGVLLEGSSVPKSVFLISVPSFCISCLRAGLTSAIEDAVSTARVTALWIRVFPSCPELISRILREFLTLGRSKEYRFNCHPQPTTNGNIFRSLLRPYTIQNELQVGKTRTWVCPAERG
ncbi:unnamed protein product [Lepeophtheirus salmonis]|uniref:(salmon louse) hypothetical protein n=1 Tax=Lepeophtheirus salmonis TaxID=72036 RepID=A0A7R8CWA6_LEPSM|nr:unnamed protein product [Lepeophtheirus salmonis]CAF2950311.1 unnamed protein product [Lepeophtheirus salmonis]